MYDSRQKSSNKIDEVDSFSVENFKYEDDEPINLSLINPSYFKDAGRDNSIKEN